MRPEARRLNHAADGALRNQLAGAHRATTIVMLVAVEGPDPSRPTLHALELVELLHADYGGLVRKHGDYIQRLCRSFLHKFF